MRNFLLLLLAAIGLFGSGCSSYESLVNYRQAAHLLRDTQLIANVNPIVIQPNDLLNIRISSFDPIAVKPFNISSGGNDQGGATDQYLVNSQGNIEFPTIGSISLKGLTLESAKTTIIEKLSPYFQQDPIVQLQLVNFKVNVNGEVARPGTFSAGNNRMTIIDAITLAGDFTSYSQRDSILIIREQNGIRKFGYVDFSTAELFASPYYYLQQNDVVYIPPRKAKVNTVRDPASRFLPWISTAISLTVLFFTISRR